MGALAFVASTVGFGSEAVAAEFEGRMLNKGADVPTMVFEPAVRAVVDALIAEAGL